MQLPVTFRDALVEQLDEVLSAYDSAADPEIVAGFLIEFVEAFGDEQSYEDIIDTLEEDGTIDGSLLAALEEEFATSDLEVTAEEAVSLFEKLCGIDWSDDLTDGDLGELDDNTEDFGLL